MKKRLIVFLIALALTVPTLTGCLNNSRSQVVVKPPATETTAPAAEPTAPIAEPPVPATGNPAPVTENPAPSETSTPSNNQNSSDTQTPDPPVPPAAPAAPGQAGSQPGSGGISNPYSDTLTINVVFDRMETGMVSENPALVAGLYAPVATLQGSSGSPGAFGAPGAAPRQISREQLQSELTQDFRLNDYPRCNVLQRKISLVNASSALVEGTLQIRQSSATATVDSINSMAWTLAKYAAGWQIVSVQTRTSQSLTITGTAAYQQKVLVALDLLQNRAPKYLTQVKSSLMAIRESQRSGAQVQIRTFELSDATLQASDSYWIASVIVHDAYHVTQYLQGRPYSGQQAEVEALDQQKAALIAMGAPQRYIDYVQQVAQTQYWNVPYGQRNW